MKYIQLKTLLERLQNSPCQLVDELHDIHSVSVTESALQQLFRQQSSKPLQPINASITGQVFYALEELGFSLNWSVEYADYLGPKGVVQCRSDAQLERIEISSDNQMVRVLDGKDKLLDHQLQPLLKEIFSNQICSWKTLPTLLVSGYQPTHLSTPDGLANLVEISEFNQISLRRLLGNQKPQQLISYYDHAVMDNETAFMRGFTHFSLNQEKPLFVSLHWLIRTPTKEYSPDLSLIETTHLSAVITTGFNLNEVNGEMMTSEKEVISIMHLLQLDREWAKMPLLLFAEWIQRQQQPTPLIHFNPITKSDQQFEQTKNANLNRIASAKLHQGKLFGEQSANNEDLSTQPYCLFQIHPTNRPQYIFEGQHITTKTHSNKGNTQVLQLYQDKKGGWVCVIETYQGGSAEITYCDVQKWTDTNQIKAFFDYNQAIAELLIEEINKQPKQP